MTLQKISLNIDADTYISMKKDVFEKRTTMSKVIRQLLQEKYGGALDEI